MGDGSSGGIGGILFEAGKAVSDAGKKQVQQVANAATSQITGNTKPLFGGPKSNTTGSFTPKPPANSFGQPPKLDPFGGLGKMFESGKPGFGAKQPPITNQPQYSQADLDKMAAENSAADQEKIAKAQAELEQLKKQHHEENYYKDIRDVGKNLEQKERERKQQLAQEEEEEKKQKEQAAAQAAILPGNPLAKNQQLGDPVAVQQAKTQTEVNRGTTG